MTCLMFSCWTPVCLNSWLSNAAVYSSRYQTFPNDTGPYPPANLEANTTTTDASDVEKLQSIHQSPVIYQALSLFSLALCLLALSFIIYQTLQTRRKPADPEEHLACSDSHHHTQIHTHTPWKSIPTTKEFHFWPQCKSAAKRCEYFSYSWNCGSSACVHVCVCLHVYQGWLDTD